MCRETAQPKSTSTIPVAENRITILVTRKTAVVCLCILVFSGLLLNVMVNVYQCRKSEKNKQEARV